MEALIFAETVFYAVVSLALIILGALFIVMVYELVMIARNLRAISENISAVSKDAEEKLMELMGKLSDSPIMSFFMKRSSRKSAGSKGRTNK